MEKIDPQILSMVGVTLLTRLTAELERAGILPLGWTAQELRSVAVAADSNAKLGANPAFQAEFAAALRRIAAISLQPFPSRPSEEG